MRRQVSASASTTARDGDGALDHAASSPFVSAISAGERHIFGMRARPAKPMRSRPALAQAATRYPPTSTFLGRLVPRREQSLNDSLMARERTNTRKFSAPQNTSASLQDPRKAGSCLGHGPAPACVVLKTKRPRPGRGLLASTIEFQVVPGEARQATRRLSAADLPERRSATISYETFWPSRSVPRPARSTALMCTNTSLPPSSGWMKPKPLVALNHFTVPMLTGIVL